MSVRTNIKSLIPLLSKCFFYVIIPISLVGMMPGGGPPGDPYIQAYNTLTVRYVATNQNTNQLLNNYNNQLLGSMTAMRDGALDAFLWAQNQSALAQIDSDTVEIIRRRVAIMLGHIAQHATNAQARAAAVQAAVPGAAALPGDQAILGALNQAEIIDQQAQVALNRAQASANQAANAMQDANNSHGHILQIINGMNQPILNINYTMNDVQGYYAQHNGARGALSDFNQANRSACIARNSAVLVHNEVNNIRQFMHNIVLLGTNLGIQLPPY